MKHFNKLWQSFLHDVLPNKITDNPELLALFMITFYSGGIAFETIYQSAGEMDTEKFGTIMRDLNNELSVFQKEIARVAGEF